VIRNSYLMNFLNLIGYALNSVWERITREAFKVFSRNRTEEESKAENSIKDNCSETNNVDDVDSSRISIENEKHRALETNYKANITIECENAHQLADQ
jgi:hypothetical protein